MRAGSTPVDTAAARSRAGRALIGLVLVSLLTSAVAVSTAGAASPAGVVLSASATATDQVFTGTEAEGGGWRTHELELDQGGSLALSMTWSDRTANLQLYLLDTTGIVAAASTPEQPETITQNVAPGSYRIAVLARSGSSAYRVTSRFTPAAPAGAAAGVLVSTTGTEDAAAGWSGHSFTVEGTTNVEAVLDWDGAAEMDLYLSGANGVVASARTGDRPERLRATLAPGSYRVAALGIAGRAAYRVRVVAIDDAPSKPSTTQVERLVFEGRDEPGGGWKVHDFSVAAPGTVSARLEWSNPRANLSLFLVGPNGALAWSAGEQRPESLAQRLASGDYRVAVKTVSEASDYRVVLTGPLGSPPAGDPATSPSRLVFTGSDARADGWKTHELEVTGRGTLVAELEASGGEATVFLIDPGGNVVAFDGSGGYPRRIEVTGSPGRWRVAVNATDGDVRYTARVIGPVRSVGARPGGSGSGSSGSGSVGAEVTRRWAAANLSNRAAFNLTEAEAVRLARDTDVISAIPGALDRHLEAMRRVNPRLEVLVYINATYAQRSEGERYPAHWYARDRSGAKIRSANYGNWLMNPLNGGWVADRVNECGAWMRARGYDGCFLDMLGSAPLFPSYGTGIPLDPRTGRPFTAPAWHQATAAIARAISAGNPGATVIGNGAANGARFFDDSQGSHTVVAALDGGVAELWLRRPNAPVNDWPTRSEWQADVDMLVEAERRGQAIYTLTRLDPWASPELTAQWRRFAVGSFLLGAQGRSHFSFTADLNRDPVGTDPLEFPAIGRPQGPARDQGPVVVREFTNGVVLVNPGSTSARVSLDGRYSWQGTTVSGQLTVPAHDARLLTRR